MKRIVLILLMAIAFNSNVSQAQTLNAANFQPQICAGTDAIVGSFTYSNPSFSTHVERLCYINPTAIKPIADCYVRSKATGQIISQVNFDMDSTPNMIYIICNDVNPGSEETYEIHSGGLMSGGDTNKITITSWIHIDVANCSNYLYATGMGVTNGNFNIVNCTTGTGTGIEIENPEVWQNTSTKELIADNLTAKLSIYDMSGKRVFENKFINFSGVINAPDNLSGIYLLKIINGSDFKTIKIIK